MNIKKTNCLHVKLRVNGRNNSQQHATGCANGRNM